MQSFQLITIPNILRCGKNHWKFISVDTVSEQAIRNDNSLVEHGTKLSTPRLSFNLPRSNIKPSPNTGRWRCHLRKFRSSKIENQFPTVVVSRLVIKSHICKCWSIYYYYNKIYILSSKDLTSVWPADGVNVSFFVQSLQL